jgi:integrase
MSKGNKNNIYKRKDSNNYYYRFEVDGVLFQGSTKTSDYKTAIKIVQLKKSEVIKSVAGLPTDNLFKKSYTFNEVFAKYMKHLFTYKSKSYIYDLTQYAKHFLPIFQNLDIKTIQKKDIFSYQSLRKKEIMLLPKNANKKESEITFRSVNIELSALHLFFNYCIESDIIDRNPCAGIKKLNELSRIKTLDDDDIQKLITGATNKLTKDLITFLIYSGCRKGEALNLKWDDVDMKNQIIAIKATKTKYDRYIPISKPLQAVLSGIEKNQDSLYVFNKNGAKLTDFKRSFHTACKNAGFKDLHIHDLRHVFASKMVMGGTSLFITGSLLGHRTTEMTKRYSHLVPETLKKAVDDVFDK